MMNDVSDIQKINNLARELMKHGQAGSMEEAIRMATQQVEAGRTAAVSEAQQSAEVPVPETSAEPTRAAEQPAQMSAGTEDIKRSVERLVEERMQDINNKINGLIAEVTALREEIKKLRESPVVPPMKPKQAKEGQTQFKAEEQQPKPKEEKKGEGHVRSGNYTPEDVSIEKVFYCGKK